MLKPFHSTIPLQQTTPPDPASSHPAASHPVLSHPAPLTLFSLLQGFELERICYVHAPITFTTLACQPCLFLLPPGPPPRPPPLQGFELERICYVRVSCVDAEEGAGVQGFTIKAYDVTDRVQGLPGPDNGLSPKQQARVQDEQVSVVVVLCTILGSTKRE